MYRKSIPPPAAAAPLLLHRVYGHLGGTGLSVVLERANELRVAVFYGCENQPADAAAARKISLQCMSVTKHTVQQCHSSLSARQNCARHSDPLEQRRCSLVHGSLYFLSLARTHTTGTGEQNEKLSAEVEMAD